MARPLDPPNQEDLPGLLDIVSRVDRELSPAPLHPIVAAKQMASLTTRIAAAAYIEEVRAKARAAEATLK